MNKEYFARIWYEENRKFSSPRIYFLKQIPTPVIGKSKIGYYNFNYLNSMVRMCEHVGTPRYTEWGADIRECKLIYTNYHLDSVALCTYRGMYRLFYYYETGTHAESQKIAKGILWNRLFGMKN